MLTVMKCPITLLADFLKNKTRPLFNDLFFRAFHVSQHHKSENFLGFTEARDGGVSLVPDGSYVYDLHRDPNI